MASGKNGNDRVRIGAGAGMADDRIFPAVKLLEAGALDYLVCECLAERTIARETLNRRRSPELGYNPLLAQRLRAFMPLCIEKNVRLVTNMGAANPLGAADVVRREAAGMGLPDVTCAVVTGDDVTETVGGHPELRLMDTDLPLEEIMPRMVSANAYLGADVVSEALATGADVVMTGRVADPSLFLGAMMHHHSWSYDDLHLMAAGTAAAHLIECSVQVTGGYFADPGKKDVEDLADLGYPFADVSGTGEITIGKLRSSGGRLDRMTCTEQLFYEVHDPARYITPDCVLDITDVDFIEEGPHAVSVRGAKGHARTGTYKTVVGYLDGYIGVGEIGYAGINAVARAELAGETVRKRFAMEGGIASELRVDIIGMTSLHGDNGTRAEPYEVRVRVAGRCPSREAADLLGDEVRQLNMQGPAGPGGPVNFGAREVIAIASVLIPRDWVRPQIVMEGT